jgi:hypothetical protein
MHLAFDTKKISGYAILIFILFLLSSSSPLSNEKSVIIGGFVFFTIVYFYFERYIKPPLMRILGICVGITVLYFIVNEGGFNAVTYLGLYINIILAYFCRDLCKEHFYTYLVNIIYVLTCISLVLFSLQLVNFEMLYNLNNFFGITKDTYAKSSSIIFTMLPIHEFRNCGFMWEPGAFVTILLMTYFINLFNIGERITSRRNIIFLIAIVTTQSTMGLLALLIPFGLVLRDYIMRNRTHQQLSVVIIPIILIIGASVFTQVDFLYDKMAKEFTEIDVEMMGVEKSRIEDYTYAISRSLSFILDMRAIKQYPLLGLGVDFRTTGFEKLGYHEKILTACGSTILILRFGFIGFFIYNYLLYKHAAYDRKLHKIAWLILVNHALFTQEFSFSSYYHLFLF